MIKIKVSTKIDLSGVKKLQKQLKAHTVNVGYINSPEHWMSEGDSVGEIARHLHYWSPWNDTFMLSDTKKGQVSSIIREEIPALPRMPVAQWVANVGQHAVSKVQENIRDVDSPSNSDDWEQIKGFNDPLAFGSRIGKSPNLVSEVTFKIGKV